MNRKQWMALSGLLTALISTPHIIHAEESDWSVSMDKQGIYGSYSGSNNRDSIIGAGVLLDANYLERGGIAIGGSFTKLSFNAGNEIDQKALYGSLHYNLHLDAIPGLLTLRIDGHGISNNDVSGDTDNVRVIAPQLSFMNYDKTFYTDLGYAYSVYQNNLKVHQFTPTIGFGFNASADWIQLRGYFVDPSNPLRAQNKNSTTAVEAKWTHWFEPGSWYRPEMAQITGLAGERIYAVDGDAAIVYNLADIQQGSASLSLQWRVSESMKLMLIGGNERYLDNTIADTYDNRLIYLNISNQW